MHLFISIFHAPYHTMQFVCLFIFYFDVHFTFVIIDYIIKAFSLEKAYMKFKKRTYFKIDIQGVKF